MAEVLPYIITFSTALLVSALLTPDVERFARRCGVLDKPNARKVHTTPTPLWGGLAVALASILSVMVGLFFFDRVRFYVDTRAMENLTGILIAGVMMLILGMVDDKISIPAKVKFLCQILIAIVLIKFKVAITFLNIPGMGMVFLPLWLTWTLTIFWIVGLTNAINLLDGLDGLLSGVSTIFAFLFFIVAIMKGQFLVALLMMALGGASLGFLRYNFNPARIFMGDTGSLFLGLMYSSLSIMGALKVTTTAAVLVPLFIMGLPVLDTSLAIIRRFLSGKPIFSPDKEHVHHKLLASGLSHRQAVYYIYIISGALGVIGLSLAIMVP